MPEISKILYFGEPRTAEIRIEGRNPPIDYTSQEEVEALVRLHHYDGEIIYVDVGNPEYEHLINQYGILGSHTWVIEFDNGSIDRYEDESRFFRLLDSCL